MTSTTESNKRTRRNIPNKTIAGLENIIAASSSAKRHWRDLVNHAEAKGDIGAGIKLARLADDLSEIERNARAARNGEEP
jgi:hypothetical protein